jgi:hypothetical protein
MKKSLGTDEDIESNQVSNKIFTKGKKFKIIWFNIPGEIRRRYTIEKTSARFLFWSLVL